MRTLAEIPFFLISSQNITELGNDVTSRKGSVRAVFGQYKGEEEVTQLCVGINKETALALGRKHNQESILFVDPWRDAHLVWCKDVKSEHVGKFKKVGKTKPKGDWTLDVSRGHVYYQVQK